VKQPQESKMKLILQWTSTSSNECCYFILRNETLFESI